MLEQRWRDQMPERLWALHLLGQQVGFLRAGGLNAPRSSYLRSSPFENSVREHAIVQHLHGKLLRPDPHQ